MCPIRAKKGPRGGQNEVLGHFYVQNALVFANFAYYDRELWYLVVIGGLSAEKNLLALKWAQLGPKRGQNEVLGYFYVQNASVFPIFHIMMQSYDI